MSATTRPCPFCNAESRVPAGARDGQRISCDRCGEPFVYHGPEVAGQDFSGSGVAGSDAPPQPISESGKPSRLWLHAMQGLAAVGMLVLVVSLFPDFWAALLFGSVFLGTVAAIWLWFFRYPRTNRAAALFVFGNMAVMATVGLLFALNTIPLRRSHDRPTKRTEEEPSVMTGTVAPASLPALRYLPAETSVIVGVHVAEALREPAGRKFLARFQPSELLAHNPQGAEVSGNLEKWTGLKLDDLDHVVLGLSLEDKLFPRMTLVAQTLRRYDRDTIRDALKANRNPEPGTQNVFRFKPDKPLEAFWPEALVWFADERTIVVGVPVDERKKIMPEPAPGIDHLPRRLRTILKDRLGPVAQAWVVGQSDDWNKTSAQVLLLMMPAADRQTLEKVRAFGGTVQLSPDFTVRAEFECADAAAAQKLEKYLVRPEAERKPLRLLGSRPEAADAGRELAESLKATRDEAWLTLQARARAETVRKALAD